MPSTTYHASDFVQAAARLGVTITVGTDGQQALQKIAPESTITLDFKDLVGACARVEKFHRRFPIDAVVATDDETTVLAAAVGEALGLAHNPVEAVLSTRSKLTLRRALDDARLPSPGYQVIDLGPGFTSQCKEERISRLGTAVQEALKCTGDSVDGISFPCVLKPTFLSASRGVIRADDTGSFRQAARRIADILHEEFAAGGGSNESHLILVEDYVPGVEYAIEAIITKGSVHPLAIFDKPDPLEGPYFEETIYVTPSRACMETQREIVTTIEKAVATLGLREGPMHAEVRVNQDGVHIIDLAARAMGGLCPRVMKFDNGVSLEELILRHALSMDCDLSPQDHQAGGVMMLPIPSAGVFRCAHGVNAARGCQAISEVTLTINPGQRMRPLPEGNRYLGFIFAHADTPAEAEAALRHAYSQLEFEIEPAQ